jgi:hypothetical protein
LMPFVFLALILIQIQLVMLVGHDHSGVSVEKLLSGGDENRTHRA